MTILINMYVFYDESGDIKAIAPSRNDFQDKTCSVAVFSLNDVEAFLKGKKNTFDYEVKKVRSFTGEKFILNRKVVEVNYTRTLDNYLTEIGPAEPGVTIISIINKKKSKVVSIELAADFRSLYANGSGEDKDIIEEILKISKTAVHLTAKHNPYHLLLSIPFSPKDLFEKGRLHFNYENDIEDASAYTKKIISGYGYEERL